MFFKLEYNVTDGQADCTLTLLRANSYIDKTLSDGRVISVRNEDDVDTLGASSFSLQIPEETPKVFKYINGSEEISQAKQNLLEIL